MLLFKVMLEIMAMESLSLLPKIRGYIMLVTCAKGGNYRDTKNSETHKSKRRKTLVQ